MINYYYLKHLVLIHAGVHTFSQYLGHLYAHSYFSNVALGKILRMLNQHYYLTF